MTEPLVILIHGAWAGTWVWTGTAAAVSAAGYRVVAVELPGVDSRPGDATLEGHINAVASVIADSDGVYLVGHSGGGVIATAVGERMPERIAGIIYVAGIMLPSGVSFPELCEEITLTSPDANGIVPYLLTTSTGSSVPPEAGVAIFFQRAPAGDAITAARMLGPWPDAVRAPIVTWSAERFGTIARFYLEAEFDRSIPLPMQRHMQARTPGAATVTLASDHAPQLSRPDELSAAILGALAEWEAIRASA